MTTFLSAMTMRKLHLLIILLLAAGITAPPAFSKPAGKPPASDVIRFADYYPLEKGTFRKYVVQKPKAKKTQTLTQVWTNGAVYKGISSIRTSISPQEWDDEISSEGQVLGIAGSDDYGNALIFDPPLIKGLAAWKRTERVTSLSKIKVGSLSEPFKLNLVFVGKSKLSLYGKTYADTISIAFNINNGESEGLLWYARGVGLVKANYSDGEYWKLRDYGKLSSPAPVIEEVAFEKQEAKFDLLIKGKNFEKGTVAVISGKKRKTRFTGDEGILRVANFAESTGPLPEVTVINPDLQTALFEVGPESEPEEKTEAVKPPPATP